MDAPASFGEPLPAPPSRLRLTAYAAEQLAWSLPALVLVLVVVLGGVLSLVWVGIPLLLLAVPLTRRLADRHRRIAARVLGTPVPSQYRPRRTDDVVATVTGWASDPMSWRDLGWLVAAASVGLVCSLLVCLLFVGVVTGALWWYGVEPLMRARCAAERWLLSYGHTERLEQRVQVLTLSRAVSVDHSATELRRIERDLHDGPQARLVALGMNLGMVDELLAHDPETAQRMLREARATTTAALGDLRAVVRGIHPPVLADRGLTAALQSLALDMALPVRVDADLAGRPPAPVESAVYFSVAECLANIGKHAAARRAWVRVRHDDGVLRVHVGDDGRGGAVPTAGSGMWGVMRRLSAFDGTMKVSSPRGGPTLITLEVPCALSSPKTTPSSGTA